MKHLISIYLLLLFISCSDQKSDPLINPNDYNAFLITSNNKTYHSAIEEIKFWNNRIKADTSGVGELGPLAKAYTTLFETTGEVENLVKAEVLYKKAIELSANNKDSYTRALGKNLISQHRFKEAKILLEESYLGKSNKRATEMLLFDVYMEIGEYAKANEFLAKIKNINDFNYLIRLAKWQDFIGESELAIKYMEMAKSIAESRNSNSLKIWTYGNLGDFYAHTGEIGKAYEYYLQTLKLQPDNVHAKLRIARIAYAIEENSSEASRILDSVMVSYNGLETYLFKAELEEFFGNIRGANSYIEEFKESSAHRTIRKLYNADRISIYAKSDPKKALELAEYEIQNRTTPHTYAYLAYALLVNGKKDEALAIIENYVMGKTYEPLALYHALLVFMANDKDEESEFLKRELKKSKFELGPLLINDIQHN